MRWLQCSAIWPPNRENVTVWTRPGACRRARIKKTGNATAGRWLFKACCTFAYTAHEQVKNSCALTISRAKPAARANASASARPPAAARPIKTIWATRYALVTVRHAADRPGTRRGMVPKAERGCYARPAQQTLARGTAPRHREARQRKKAAHGVSPAPHHRRHPHRRAERRKPQGRPRTPPRKPSRRQRSASRSRPLTTSRCTPRSSMASATPFAKKAEVV